MTEALIKGLKSNLVLLIFTIGYSIYLGSTFYKIKRYGGKKISTFPHKSIMRTVAFVVIGMALFYLISFTLSSKKTIEQGVTVVLFMYFVIIVYVTSIKEATIYQNGVYYGGKFVLFSQMLDIKKQGKNDIIIKTDKKGFANVLYLSKVMDEKIFIKSVKKRMKAAKKAEKNKEALNNK